MLGPHARRRIRAESHAQEEGGESCEKTLWKLWILLKILVCWVYLDFILKDFELILRTVNILCTLFNPPMVDPVFPFIPFKTCFEHLYCAFFFFFCKYSTLMLLICSSKLHPEGSFSTTYIWRAVLAMTLKKKIQDLHFPIFTSLMQLNVLLREKALEFVHFKSKSALNLAFLGFFRWIKLPKDALTSIQVRV